MSSPLDLRIRMLGGFDVRVGDRVVPRNAWRVRKAGALVKVLALAPGTRMHREQLGELFWPEVGHEAAGLNLRYVLHVARRALGAGADCLARDGPWVVLCPPGRLRTDVAAFEAVAGRARRSGVPAEYEAAIGLYAGDLLPDDRDEEWAAARRDELRDLYRDLLAEAAQLHEARGAPEAAIGALRRLVAARPDDEEAHRALMRLYALTGRRQRALDQYRQLREALAEQLDAEPDEASRRLRDEIEAGTVAAAGATVHHNLPRPLTSFVGLADELDAIVGLLRDSGGPPLVTLVGAGGSGKTRLAIEAAGKVLDDYPDGVRLVELAALADPALLPQAVASVLGVREASSAALAAQLGDRRLLLLLDNCEHLAGACAALAGRLLGSCPRLRVLATSRHPLDVSGEAVRPLRLLGVPPERPDRAAPADGEWLSAVVGAEAARLFVDRARLSQPGFAVNVRNAQAVAAVCRRLEGLPLALELAAARLRALSVEQVAERLDAPLSLLASRSPAVAERHRTLRGVVDWSHGLLSPDERILFARLAVFVGGWTLEAAEEVCGFAPLARTAVVELLSGLVDKSLVVPEPDDYEGRYRFLETIRGYAAERQAEGDEVEALRDRHLAWMTRLAARARRDLDGPRQREWLERLGRELDNLRAALGWCAEGSAEHAAAGLRLVALVAKWFWEGRAGTAGRGFRWYVAEGVAWLERFLEKTQGDPRSRADALVGLGLLLRYRQEMVRARAANAEALELYRCVGDEVGSADALQNLGLIEASLGELAAACTHLEESLALMRRHAGLDALQHTTRNLAVGLMMAGDRGRARALLEESLAVTRRGRFTSAEGSTLVRLGTLDRLDGDLASARRRTEAGVAILEAAQHDHALLIGRNALANLARAEGDHERAEELLRAGLERIIAAGASELVPEQLCWLGILAAARGDDGRAVRLIAAGTPDGVVGSVHNADLRVEGEACLAAARRRLGEAAYDQEWRVGRAMTVEQARAETEPRPGVGELGV